jgi:hypothetical protein
MTKTKTIPEGRWALKIDIVKTLTTMRVGEIAAFEVDEQRYARVRVLAAQLKRQNVGMWSTSAKLIPNKVVVTRLA